MTKIQNPKKFKKFEFRISDLEFRISNKNGGQIMMITAIMIIFISLTIIFGIVTPVIAQIKNASRAYISRESYFLAEAGTEDVLYRIKNGLSVDTSETLSLNGNSVQTTISNTVNGKRIIADASYSNQTRKIQTDVTEGIGVAFNFGVQAGDGGMVMENNSTVNGNIYSNGPITGNDNLIQGDAISAGSDGLINHIHATGDMYAHTIQNSQVDGDAYYQNISVTTVNGNTHPGSGDQTKSELPITDEMIDLWEQEAEAGGVTNCSGTLTIQTDSAIGPQKYTCNVTIKKNGTEVTVGGPIWVVGDLRFDQSPTVSVDSLYGAKSLPIIADKPSDKYSSSRIIVENNTQFNGSGSNKSFVLLLSTNNQAESGGSNFAIQVQNNILGDVLVYAGHGLIQLENNADLKEVTGYKIKTKNNAEVIYDTGIASLLFSSGPSGGYTVDSWKEIP